jgi:cyclohexanone monooxygenase
MDEVAHANGSADQADLDVVIIGSGFAGLYALHKLRNELGLEVRSFDDAGGVGGTWYWNRYPGARSDTEVTAYCYSFDRQLFDDWKWTERYPRQHEILAYLNHVADRYDLRRSITFDTTLLSAVFNEETNRWDIVTSGGEHISAQFLVAGVGLLSSTVYPDITGRETFAGQTYHTARWPHQPLDLTGKRVGVIGTGSSGVQVITEMAPQVERLVVFQRRPQYTVPAQHGPIPAATLAEIRADYGGYWASVRGSVTAFGFAESAVPAMSVTDAEREAVFQQAWDIGGGFRYMFATFGDIGVDPVANEAAASFIRRKIGEIVTDPHTAATLTPYDLYARRPLCDAGYFETFNRDNVDLVDLQVEPIEEITPAGIRTSAADYDLDIIVFATGFDAVTGNYVKIDIRGRDGQQLRDKWVDGPRCLLGMVNAGFPNMFMIFGPMGPFTNQPPAHEVQVDWIAAAIQRVRNNGHGFIEATKEAEDAWVDECNEIANATLFTKIDSWINGANVEGKPVSVMFYMAGMGAYCDRLEQLVENDYAGFAVGETTH